MGVQKQQQDSLRFGSASCSSLSHSAGRQPGGSSSGLGIGSRRRLTTTTDMIWGRSNWVRVTHLPTGLSVTADFSPANVKNRDKCYAMLRGMLWSLEHGDDVGMVTDAQREIAESILKRTKGRSDDPGQSDT